MPKFSQESFSKLSTCHQDLQTLFYEVIRNFDCTIIEGYRGQVEQDEAFDKGYSKLRFPDGKHNGRPSMAVDVSPYPIDWNNIKRLTYFAGFVMGIAQRLKDEGKMTYSIRWGGNWDGGTEMGDQIFNDLVHFELC